MNLKSKLLPIAILLAGIATAQKPTDPANCRIEVFADQPGATMPINQGQPSPKIFTVILPSTWAIVFMMDYG